jgi:hypothetical protein
VSRGDSSTAVKSKNVNSRCLYRRASARSHMDLFAPHCQDVTLRPQRSLPPHTPLQSSTYPPQRNVCSNTRVTAFAINEGMERLQPVEVCWQQHYNRQNAEWGKPRGPPSPCHLRDSILWSWVSNPFWKRDTTVIVGWTAGRTCKNDNKWHT